MNALPSAYRTQYEPEAIAVESYPLANLGRVLLFVGYKIWRFLRGLIIASLFICLGSLPFYGVYVLWEILKRHSPLAADIVAISALFSPLLALAIMGILVMFDGSFDRLKDVWHKHRDHKGEYIW